MSKVIRYVVRPRSATIKGWYVWAVESVGSIERWASDPMALYPTKREAKAVAQKMNKAIKETK